MQTTAISHDVQYAIVLTNHIGTQKIRFLINSCELHVELELCLPVNKWDTNYNLEPACLVFSYKLMDICMIYLEIYITSRVHYPNNFHMSIKS